MMLDSSITNWVRLLMELTAVVLFSMLNEALLPSNVDDAQRVFGIMVSSVFTRQWRVQRNWKINLRTLVCSLLRSRWYQMSGRRVKTGVKPSKLYLGHHCVALMLLPSLQWSFGALSWNKPVFNTEIIYLSKLLVDLIWETLFESYHRGSFY